MSLAASLGGIALRGPHGGIPHDIGHYIGANYHVAHGTASGCFLAETMRFIAPVVPDKVKIVAECMGAEVSENATPEEIGDIACGAIRKLYKETGMPPLSSFVPTKAELIDNIDDTFHGMSNSPRLIDHDGALMIVGNSYDNN